MTLNAVFRVDGSASIGGGHVSRCLTLANVLTSRNWSCTFVSLSDSVDVFPDLGVSKHELVFIDSTLVDSTGLFK